MEGLIRKEGMVVQYVRSVAKRSLKERGGVVARHVTTETISESK